MSRPKVPELRLRQFRSYADTVVNLGDVTFIVGRNAAGKSNLLDFLIFISEVALEPLLTVIDRRGGIASLRRKEARRGAPSEMFLGIEMISDEWSGRYRLWLKAAKNQGYVVDAENCVLDIGNVGHEIYRRGTSFIDDSESTFRPKLTDDALFLPLISGIEPFDQFSSSLASIRVYSIDPLQMKEPQVPDDGKVLKRDGSNAASVIREMRKTDSWSVVLAFLKAAVPQINDVESKRDGSKLSLEFKQGNDSGQTVKFPGFQASDGTLRILGILLALLQSPSPTLVAIEEPEANVHPGALGVLLDAIKYAAAKTQVVITTQSPDILDAKWIKPEDIRIVEWIDGQSEISGLSPGAVDVLGRHLRTPGELLRAGALESSR